MECFDFCCMEVPSFDPSFDAQHDQIPFTGLRGGRSAVWFGLCTLYFVGHESGVRRI